MSWLLNAVAHAFLRAAPRLWRTHSCVQRRDSSRRFLARFLTAAPCVATSGDAARRSACATANGLCLLAMAAGAAAQTGVPLALRDVGIDQKLNQPAPLDAVFAGEDGQRRPLRDYLRGKPVVLALVYYECPMLCEMTMNGVLRAARAMPLDAGKDFDIIAVSFDAKETPAEATAKRDQYVRQYRRPGSESGWRFLTGDQPAIDALARAAGFRYTWDASTRQWAHASGIMVLTPEGRFSRYFYGIEYSARDLRLGLVEASRGRIGSAVDRVLLYCFHYDPRTGRYGLVILNIIRAAGGATVLGLCGFWWAMARQRRKAVHVA